MNKKCVYGSLISLILPLFFQFIIKEITPISKIVYHNYNLKRLSLEDEKSETLTSISSEKVDILVKFDYEDLVVTDLISEDDENYREMLLSLGKKYYSTKNAQLMERINTERMENLYVSKYSPFFCFTVDSSLLDTVYKEDLPSLERNNDVELVSVALEPKYVGKLNNAKSAQNISYIQNDLGYTGKNVKVGILEPSILDKNHANFEGKDVTVRDEWYYIETVKDHTTEMGSIIGGKYGVAPDCSLYSVELSGNAVSEFDWLLDQGVDIVNMSYGEKNLTGNYNNDSAYVDYIVKTYKLICVAAAGNEGEGNGYVGNPGLGYNVLTVGACSNTSPSRASYSSYIENTGSDKPNIMASGNMWIPGFNTDTIGTSNSAAFVSGCIALMLEARPALKSHPEAVYAILCATADSLGGEYSGLRNDIGAGGINIQRAIENIDCVIYGTNTDTSYFYEEVNVYVSNGSKLKISAFWLVNADGNANNTNFTDYDLYVINTSPSFVKKVNSARNNSEHIEFTVSEHDRYSLALSMSSQGLSSVNDNYALAYYLVY